MQAVSFRGTREQVSVADESGGATDFERLLFMVAVASSSA